MKQEIQLDKAYHKKIINLKIYIQQQKMINYRNKFLITEIIKITFKMISI